MSAEVKEQSPVASKVTAEAHSPAVSVSGPDAPMEDIENDVKVQESKQNEDHEMADTSVNGDTVDRNSAEPETQEKSSKATSDDDKEDTKSTTSTATKKSSRSSIGGSSSRTKKVNRRKSIAPEIHLDTKPGDYWFARMKGHPPWPAVICDEQMLPVTLLSKRPVSAKRIDGTWREDFDEDGKNVKDRRYPIMFLGTNEFAWHPNTDLQVLKMKEIQTLVKNDTQGKRSKLLWEAYAVAAKNHNLDFFKDMLQAHQLAVVEEAKQIEETKRAKEEREATKLARELKKGSSSRKSVGGESDYDGMDVDEDSKSTKSSKKRKADADADPARPTKTLKTKPSLKLQKVASGKSTAKSTPRKSVAASPTANADQRARYFRNQLQRRFLPSAKDNKVEKPLSAADMPELHEIFNQLEADSDNLPMEAIEAHRLKTVLKAISKLDDIPLDSKFSFRQRATAIRDKWLERTGDGTQSTLNTPSTAGPRSAKEKSNGAAKPEVASPAKSAEAVDSDGDAVMSGANGNEIVEVEEKPEDDGESSDQEKEAIKEDIKDATSEADADEQKEVKDGEEAAQDEAHSDESEAEEEEEQAEEEEEADEAKDDDDLEKDPEDEPDSKDE